MTHSFRHTLSLASFTLWCMLVNSTVPARAAERPRTLLNDISQNPFAVSDIQKRYAQYLEQTGRSLSLSTVTPDHPPSVPQMPPTDFAERSQSALSPHGSALQELSKALATNPSPANKLLQEFANSWRSRINDLYKQRPLYPTRVDNELCPIPGCTSHFCGNRMAHTLEHLKDPDGPLCQILSDPDIQECIEFHIPHPHLILFFCAHCFTAPDDAEAHARHVIEKHCNSFDQLTCPYPGCEEILFSDKPRKLCFRTLESFYSKLAQHWRHAHTPYRTPDPIISGLSGAFFTRLANAYMHNAAILTNAQRIKEGLPPTQRSYTLPHIHKESK